MALAFEAMALDVGLSVAEITGVDTPSFRGCSKWQDSDSENRGTPECTALFHRLLVKGASGSKKGGNHDKLFYERLGELRDELTRRWPTMKFSTNATGSFSSRQWGTFKQGVKKNAL